MNSKRMCMCSGVINSRLVEDSVIAVSDKQAWYFFCKKNKTFKVYDFKVLGYKTMEPEQLKFNI